MHELSFLTSIPTSQHQLVIPVFKGKEQELSGFDSELLKLAGVDSKPGTTVQLSGANQVVSAIGVGDGLKPMDFGAAAIRAALNQAKVIVDVRAFTEDQIAEIALGLLIGGKTPTSFKKPKSMPESVQLLVDSGKEVDLSATNSLAEEILRVRELINTPANDLWPAKLAETVESVAKGLPLEVEVWDEKKLEVERCGGILAVGRGSARPPRLVILKYRGGGKHLGLVGKGITFDTGGLSIKPADSMVGMKYDMAGSATVFGAITAIAKLGLKVDVTAVMAIAENMPSGTATRPGDVAIMRNGKSVEIINTDAEGRLVLGDGLDVLAEFKPDHIVDVATLTGAATIALGKRYAGVMGHGDAVGLTLEAAKQADELLWHMPLPEELRQVLDSDIADMTNAKVGNRAGGMLVGGWFLSEFVSPEASWAHLDIAGPANNDASPYSVNPSGATAIMLRTLVQLARNLQSS